MRPTYSTENSVILMQFRQFCSELLRLKQRVEERYPPAAEARASAPSPSVHGVPNSSFPDPNSPEPDFPDLTSTAFSQDPNRPQSNAPNHSSSPGSSWQDTSPAEEVRQSLLALLEQQSQRSSELGGALGLGLYREAQYVMTALADEIFLNARWSERNRWPLLEQEIFQTHASGDLFFHKLDRLIANQSAGSNDLAMIYFQALALDFRGRYRGSDPNRHLERYRRQLYHRIFREAPEVASREPIFLGTYDANVIDEQDRRLPSPHLWWLVLAAVCVLWIFGSTLLWRSLTGDIKMQIQQIGLSSRASEADPR